MILIAHKTRTALIRIGKILPFVLCALVLLSYCETLYALYNNDLLEFGNFYVLNKPISWSIGAHFAYNIQMLFLIFIISFAIQTCVYNKLACSFLAINLYEKSFFETHVFNEKTYYLISIINILICAFICYEGLKRTIKWK